MFRLSSIGFFGAAISLTVTSKSELFLTSPSNGVDLELTKALGAQIGLCHYVCSYMSVLSTAIKGGAGLQNAASTIGARSFDSPSPVLS